MDYFVNIEDTTYYHWQLELLIESFNFHKIQDKLLVGIEQSKDKFKFFRNLNILAHERKFGYENIGDVRGYKAINSFYALVAAIKNEHVSPHFVSIPPDTVLKKPLQIEEKEYPEIIFFPDPFLTFENTQKNVGNFWEWLQIEKEECIKKWVPIGPIMIFNKIPIEIFERATSFAETLAMFQLMENKKIWEFTDRLAWCITLSGFFDQISLNLDADLASNMLDSKNTPFIHYEHGLPPVFNKKMFSFLPPYHISFGNPFEILKNHYPTPNSHFISLLSNEIYKRTPPFLSFGKS